MFPKDQVRKQIVQYFKAVGSGQNIIQAIKQALFLNQNFNPLVLFEMLSQGKQRVSRNDWRRYLTNRSIAFSKEELRYFFRHNHFGEEITLNQFLQALIPYNADVIREFKAKYLDSLEITELDPEVDFIFAELMINWIDFIRNLIKIRASLGRNAKRSQIQHLVKEDLVLRSKPREAKKFLEAFQQSTFQLSFHELRKFLEMQISQQEIIHEFYLLNVKRHIKCENPFQKIVPRSRKSHQQHRSRSRSLSGSRSISASRSISRRKQDPNTNQPKRRPVSSKNRSSNQQFNSHSVNIEEDEQFSSKRKGNGSKYQEFKKELQHSMIEEMERSGLMSAGGTGGIMRGDSRAKNRGRNQSGGAMDTRGGNNSARRDIQRQPQPSHLTNQLLQQNLSKQKPPTIKLQKQRQKQKQKQRTPLKSSQSQPLIKMFQEIVLKQDRLEKLRKQLAKTSDFSITGLFKLIDSANGNKGYVSNQALQKWTGESENFSAMINFYAREKDKLRPQELGLIFRPLSKQLNQQIDSRPEPKTQPTLKKQTSRLILQILHLESQMHLNLNLHRANLRKEGVSPRSLFQYLDTKNQGFLTVENLKNLLEENNINCQPKDMKCLMKLFDRKIDEKIGLREFLGFIDF